MNFSDDVQFPKRYKPLPPGYRIVQLDSGHFLWEFAGDGKTPRNRPGGECEGLISWDRYWVRRCAFAHAARAKTP